MRVGYFPFWFYIFCRPNGTPSYSTTTKPIPSIFIAELKFLDGPWRIRLHHSLVVPFENMFSDIFCINKNIIMFSVPILFSESSRLIAPDNIVQEVFFAKDLV